MKADIRLPQGMEPLELRPMLREIEARFPDHGRWTFILEEPRDQSAWHAKLVGPEGESYTAEFDGPEERQVGVISRWLMDTLFNSRSR